MGCTQVAFGHEREERVHLERLRRHELSEEGGQFSQLPRLADSDIRLLGAAEDAFFAAVSLSGKVLPLPIGTRKPQLAVARAQSVDDQRERLSPARVCRWTIACFSQSRWFARIYFKTLRW
jgi:hypothetical protein